MRRFLNIITVYSSIVALSFSLMPYKVFSEAANIEEKNNIGKMPSSTEKVTDSKSTPLQKLGNSDAQTTETTNGQKITYQLPVNVFNNKINLKVDVLPDFKKIPAIPGQEQTLIEFIPVSTADPYKWSEIITISPIIGAKLSAKTFLDFFLEAFKKNATDVKVLDASNTNEKDFQSGYQIIQYHVGERDEMVLVYAASGPYDLATAQYAVQLTKTDKESTEAAVQKLKTFMKNNIQIIGQ